MLTEQCQKDLNFLINHLRFVGVRLNAARRIFQAQKDIGVAMMLKNEAMERWDISGMIGDYIIEQGGEVVYAKTPAPPGVAGEVGASYLTELVNVDATTYETLDTMIVQAAQRGAFDTVMFMREIRHIVKKENDELRARVDDLVSVVNDPAAYTSYDHWLQKEYAEQHYKYSRNC